MPDESNFQALKQRPYIISWLIDSGLLIAVLVLAWNLGAYTEQIANLIEGQAENTARITQLESRPMGPEARTRISVLEKGQANQDDAIRVLKQDLTSRLDRIEDKLDAALR